MAHNAIIAAANCRMTDEERMAKKRAFDGMGLGAVPIIRVGSARCEKADPVTKKAKHVLDVQASFLRRPGGFFASPCGFAQD